MHVGIGGPTLSHSIDIDVILILMNDYLSLSNFQNITVLSAGAALVVDSVCVLTTLPSGDMVATSFLGESSLRLLTRYVCVEMTMGSLVVGEVDDGFGLGVN